MTPASRAVLADFAARLGGVIIPDLKTPYLMGATGLMAALLGMMAEETDGAAARLVEENRAIRALFSQALTLAPPATMAERMAPLASAVDDDLHLSALEAANRPLRAALIDLHAWAETQPGAATLNLAIWAELSQSTRRRKLSAAPF